MGTRHNKISAALLLCLAAILPAAVCAAQFTDAAYPLAREIADYAYAHGINRIAVQDFQSLGTAAKEDTYSLTERISGLLAGRSQLPPAEKNALAAVSGAAGKTSAQAAAELLRASFAVDALITGTVFCAGDSTTIVLRLINIKTGRVVLTARAAVGGQNKAPAAPSEVKIPGFPGPYPWQDAADVSPVPASSPADLRDAVSDNSGSRCAQRKLTLAGRNKALVDAKARYWAGKMKEPSFSSRKLRKNPGIEIGDPAVKTAFYGLLSEYYTAASPAAITPAELIEVLDLMAQESEFPVECALR